MLLIHELYIDVYQGDVKRLHNESENQFDGSKLYVCIFEIVHYFM